jgi:plastocyanin
MEQPMSNTTRRLAFAAACLLAIAATACSSSGTKSSATTTAGSSAPAALTIQNTSFGAASVTAATEFTIQNKDSARHTVTDDAGSFDVSVPAGGTASLTIPKAGTYKIHCKIHASMHGTITVA